VDFNFVCHILASALQMSPSPEHGERLITETGDGFGNSVLPCWQQDPTSA
jgi:hypothetical protein